MSFKVSLLLAPKALNIPISFLEYDIDTPIKFENSNTANSTNTRLTTKRYLYNPE